MIKLLSLIGKNDTWLEKFVFNKLSQLGYDVLSQQKNKFINYSICLILRDLFNDNINNSFDSSIIIKELLDNKEIWSYNIQNGSVIQMLAKPLQNKLGENKNLKLKILSGITIDNDEEIDKKENENDEVDNLQETFTEHNKLFIKLN